MSNLEKLVDAAAEVINVVTKVVNKEGIWHLVALSDEVASLGTIKKEELLAELAACTPERRKELDKLFQDKLVLSNKELEAKIEKGALALEKSIDVVLHVITVYNEAKQIVNDVKQLVA